jgi:PAS domain S-box-containing protein
MEPNEPIIPVEEHFRIIADSAPVLIWIANTDKLCYFFNAGWFRFTGRTPEEEYGDGWTKGVHPDDLQHCLDIYFSSFDARKEFKMEYRLRRHDGKYQWLLDHGVPRYTRDGTFAGYIGSCVVIDELLETERVKKEFIHAEALETEQALNEQLATANEELAATNEELVSINEELYQTQESLNNLNDELEEQVSIRTIELTESEAKAQVLNEELMSTVKELSLSRKKLINHIENLHNLVRQAPVGMCIVSGQPLSVEEVNDVFLEIIGKKRDQFRDSPYWAVNSEAAPYYESVTHLVMATGEAYHADEYELRLIRDGRQEIVYADFVYEPIKGITGNVDSIMIVAIDVTDKVNARKLIEQSANELAASNEELAAYNEEMAAMNEELAATNEELTQIQINLQQMNHDLGESESRLKMAIESTNLGTWDWNLLNDSLYLSAECNSIFGLNPGQSITSDKFFSCVYDEDRGRVQQEIETAISIDRSPRHDLTYRIIRFDNNEMRWIRVQGIVHFNSAGFAFRFIGSVLDITEDKMAEEKSAKLAAIIASSDDAIISKTLNSVITSWNESAQRMFGYSADEIIGETIYKLIPPDRQQEEPEILSRLKRGERVTHFETKRVTKDGRLIDVSLTISPVKNPEGKIIGLSKIARDITEKKLDEARKNDFIGMVSHELKTPLTSLTGLLQLANVKLKNSEDSFLPAAMEKANMQVKRMSNMINGFLNVSRLESGKIMIEKHDFNLEDLIDEVIKETEFTVSTHTIKFEPGKPVIVNADYDKISSVITNLISNAVKYSPNGKTIEIQCNLVDGAAQVSIRDEGMGINPYDKEKLFERYYRVENNNTQHISGFGIGLYLSSEIIHRHDGKIWVESESGVGSTFFFSLPLSTTHQVL